MSAAPALVALALSPLVVPALPAGGPVDQSIRSTASAPFVNFEGAQLRPLLLALDGRHLYALNTSDHRVEILRTDFATSAPGGLGSTDLRHVAAIFTGLEPVSMCLHPDDANVLFVANQVSDSVSVVDLERRTVVATIPAGDEPTDVAVAAGKLFVATARSAVGAGLTDPGTFVENAVVVADAQPPYAILDRIEIPAHRPRALEVVGQAVYVVPLNSGNHTTILNIVQTAQLGISQTDTDAFNPSIELNPALLEPRLSGPQFTSPFGVNGWELPQTSKIVLDSEHPGLVPQLPDNDIVGIDAVSHAILPGITHGVGTTLFDIERNPVTGDLWVTGTEAHNRVRFEPAISGRSFSNRVSIAAPGAPSASFLELAPPFTNAKHAQPAALAFYSGEHGDFAYVAALGTASVVVIDAVTQAALREIPVGTVPSGLAVDAKRGRLYVLSRGEGSIRTFDIGAGHAPLGAPFPLGYDAEPKAVRDGRIHLYEARSSSGHGTGNMSCASCHVFGHMDASCWDLGNPAGGLGYYFPDLLTGVLSWDGPLAPRPVANNRVMQTHPMKGPMTTQSLRGLEPDGARPLHWRGDRRFFQIFRGAFVGLLGGDGISHGSMQEFANFIDALVYPPNPLQPKDRVYTGDEAAGRDLFGMNPDVPGKVYNNGVPNVDGSNTVTCISCHKGDFTGKSDFTGSQPTANFDGEAQLFNTGQLRGLYEKEFRSLTGFGTLHDGSIEGVDGFLSVTLGGVQGFPNFTPEEKAQTAKFVRAWDTGIAPLVGEQITASASNLSAVGAWLDLAERQAQPPVENVDLIAKGSFFVSGAGFVEAGFAFGPNPVTGAFEYRSSADKWFSRDELLTLVTDGSMTATFTCVPVGTAVRLGIDRDEDDVLDLVEPRLGTSPVRPDTDGDGYADSVERGLGGKPTTFDYFLAGDTTPPGIQSFEARNVFASAATLDVRTDEGAHLTVRVGTSAGSADVGTFFEYELRRRHAVVLTGLPANTDLHYAITAMDRNGNAATVQGTFETAPRMVHVEEITLEASSSAPYTITAHVRVADQDGNPVELMPVKSIWSGPSIAGTNWFTGPGFGTDANGTTSIPLGQTVGSGETVTYSVAFLGSLNPAHVNYVGTSGGDANFFYDQSSNKVSYATITLP